MNIPSAIIGTTVGPRVHEIDARWLMAFAAALGETAPEYLDTRRPGGLLAHPLFPVCYEWPLAGEIRAGLPREVAARAVHLTHDLRIHRLPRAGDRLSTTATVASVTGRASGAFMRARFETMDAAGEPVSLTDYGNLFRGVECETTGPAASGARSEPGAMPAAGEHRWSAVVAVPANLAHVYTECARIWNPIHTDRAVAQEAGLPDIILHGTATLGLAVSEVLRREAAGDPSRVRRITGRFGAMVLMPSTLTIQGLGVTDTPDGRWVAFEALTHEGRPAVRDGQLLLRP